MVNAYVTKVYSGKGHISEAALKVLFCEGLCDAWSKRWWTQWLRASQQKCRLVKTRQRLLLPHSLALALCDVWVPPKVKMTMKGQRLGSVQDGKEAITVQLKTPGKTSGSLQKVAKTIEWVYLKRRGEPRGGLRAMCLLLYEIKRKTVHIHCHFDHSSCMCYSIAAVRFLMLYVIHPSYSQAATDFYWSICIL